MGFFYLLAAGFLLFTVLMVLFFVFMGILQWREERDKPVVKLARPTKAP